MPVNAVRNVIVWGNHSSTMCADVDHALVRVDLIAANTLPQLGLVSSPPKNCDPAVPVQALLTAKEKLTPEWHAQFTAAIQNRGG